MGFFLLTPKDMGPVGPHTIPIFESLKIWEWYGNSMVDSRTPYPSSHKSWVSGKWGPNLQYFCFLSILGDFPTMIMGERINDPNL